MNEKKIKTAIPKLRFPEFKDENKWVENKVGSISKSYSGGTPITSSKAYYGGDIPFIRSAEINKKHTELFITNEGLMNSSAKMVNKGDLLIALYGANSGDVAISRIDGAINQAILCLKSNNNTFLHHYFTYKKDEIVKTYIQGGQGNLSGEIIKSIDLYFTIPNEQTKIAECLSSLDDVISGVSDKIETLKNYKKGLMQQLFPAEGKTTPTYRFSEFQNNEEWDINVFSRYIKLYRGSSPRPIKEYITTDEDGVNWIKIGDTKNAKSFVINRVEEKITVKGSLKSRAVYKGELILANSMSFGKTYLLNVNGCIYDGWFVLREYEEFFHKPFLLQLLNSEYMQNQYKKLSAGGIVQNISSEIVYQTIVPHTDIEEQKKIANCLTSIDNLIAAETNHFEQLKAHKKGLMQQLFPNLNE